MSWLNILEAEKNVSKLIQIYQDIPSKGTAGWPKPADLAALIKRDLKKSSQELLGTILDCLLVLLTPSGFPDLKDESAHALGSAIVKLSPSEKPLRIKMLKCLGLITYTDEFVREHMVQFVGLMMDAISPPGASILKASQLLNRLLKEHTEVMIGEARHWIGIFATLLVEDSEGVQKLGNIWIRQYVNQLAPMADDLGSILSLRDEYLQKHLLEMIQIPGKELYTLRVWGTLITLLGKELHTNVQLVNLFLPVIQQGFTTLREEVYIESLASWNKLITNFSQQPNVIASARRLKLLLNPLLKESRTETMLKAKLTTWWHLVSSLGSSLNGASFSMVAVPLLKLCLSQRSVTRAGQIQNETLVAILRRSGSEMLCRMLEVSQRQPQSRLRSPKKAGGLDIKALKVPLAFSTVITYRELILSTLSLAVDFLLESPSAATPNRMSSTHLLQYLLQVLLIRISFTPSSVEGYLDFVSASLKLVLHWYPKVPTAVRRAVVEEVALLPSDILSNPQYDLKDRPEPLGSCIHFLRFLLQEYDIDGLTEQSLETFNTLLQASVKSSFRPLDLLCTVLPERGRDYAPQVWGSLSSAACECIQDLQLAVNFPDNLKLLTHPFSTFLNPSYAVNSLQENQLRNLMVSWGPLYKGLSQLAVSPNLVCYHVCTSLLELATKQELGHLAMYNIVSTEILSTIIRELDLNEITGSTQEISVQSSDAKLQQMERTTPFVKFFGRVFAAFRNNLDAGGLIMDTDSHVEMWTKRMEYLLPKVLTTPLALPLLRKVVPTLASLATNNWSHMSLNPKIEQLLGVVYREVQCSSLDFNSKDLLAALSPLLEATLVHGRRTMVERARVFWNSCFPKVDSGAVPASLRECVKQMKTPILISSPPTTPHKTQQRNTLTTPKTPVNQPEKINPSTPKTPVGKSLASMLTPKSSKKAPEQDDSHFVVIQPKPKSSRRILTEHQKEKRREKSFLPSMYNELSQDTQRSLTNSAEESVTCSESTILAEKLPLENRESPEKIVSGVVDTEMAMDESPLLHRSNFSFLQPESPYNLHLSLSFSGEEDMIPSSQETSALSSNKNPVVVLKPLSEAQLSEAETPVVLAPESQPEETAQLPISLTCPETEDFLPTALNDRNSPPPSSAAVNEQEPLSSATVNGNNPPPPMNTAPPPHSSTAPVSGDNPPSPAKEVIMQVSPPSRNRRVRKLPTKITPQLSRKRKRAATPASSVKRAKLIQDLDEDVPLIVLKKQLMSQNSVEETQEPMDTNNKDETSPSILLPQPNPVEEIPVETSPEKPEEMEKEAQSRDKENLQPLELADAEPSVENSPVKAQTPLKRHSDFLSSGRMQFNTQSRGWQMLTIAAQKGAASPTIHTYSPSASPSASILKRKPNLAKGETPRKSKNRVSFSVPLVVSQIEIEPKQRYEFRTSRHKPPVVVTSKQEPEPALDDNQIVFPLLKECQDPVETLIAPLALTGSRGLNHLLVSRKITTVGDLASLRIADVANLPIKKPKLSLLLSTLKSHYSHWTATPVKSLHSPSKLTRSLQEETTSAHSKLVLPSVEETQQVEPQEKSMEPRIEIQQVEPQIESMEPRTKIQQVEAQEESMEPRIETQQVEPQEEPRIETQQVKPQEESMEPRTEIQQVEPQEKSMEPRTETQQVEAQEESMEPRIETQQVEPQEESMEPRTEIQQVEPQEESMEPRIEIQQVEPQEESMEPRTEKVSIIPGEAPETPTEETVQAEISSMLTIISGSEEFTPQLQSAERKISQEESTPEPLAVDEAPMDVDESSIQAGEKLVDVSEPMQQDAVPSTQAESSSQQGLERFQDPTFKETLYQQLSTVALSNSGDLLTLTDTELAEAIRRAETVQNLLHPMLAFLPSPHAENFIKSLMKMYQASSAKYFSN